MKDYQNFIDTERRHFTNREYNKDNDLLISYNVKNPFNMIPWILKYGSDVEVFEPEPLRHKIEKELYEIIQRYKEW